MPHSNKQSYAGLLKVMIFIDGGYIRENLKRIQKHVEGDLVDYSHLSYILTNRELNFGSFENIYIDLIRLYWYDAIADPLDALQKYNEQKEYLTRVKNIPFCELRLGRLVRSKMCSDEKEAFRQKGVDILLAIDMISHAYENHYDIAILLSGDDDIQDIVKAVKNAGKRVFGAYFSKHISEGLKDCFDKSYELKLSDFD
jgi:uncharacterized LabA/DUF88 family protein